MKPETFAPTIRSILGKNGRLLQFVCWMGCMGIIGQVGRPFGILMWMLEPVSWHSHPYWTAVTVFVGFVCAIAITCWRFSVKYPELTKGTHRQ